MRARFCKKKNTYTNEECRCDCSELSKQGIGSLVGQSIDNSQNVSTERNNSYESTDYDL